MLVVSYCCVADLRHTEKRREPLLPSSLVNTDKKGPNLLLRNYLGGEEPLASLLFSSCDYLREEGLLPFCLSSSSILEERTLNLPAFLDLLGSRPTGGSAIAELNTSDLSCQVLSLWLVFRPTGLKRPSFYHAFSEESSTFFESR